MAAQRFQLPGAAAAASSDGDWSSGGEDAMA
jgi:hypothetical protein